MRPLTRLILALAAAALLQGCQTGLPGGGTAPQDGVTPNAVLGGDIEVVALDPPPPDPSAAPPPPPPVPDQSAPDAAPEAEAEPLPPAPKSAAQIACEDDRGQWTPTGMGDLHICVFATRDAGKRCTRESQCEGVCLARSGTCSPIRPLLGCHEILQENGARVTQCIE